MDYQFFVISASLLLIPVFVFWCIIVLSKRKFKDVYRQAEQNPNITPKVIMKKTTEETEDESNSDETEILEEVDKTELLNQTTFESTELLDDSFTKTILLEDEKVDYVPQKGDLLNGKYRVERVLGSGAQGSVFVCTNIELGNTWAAKYFNGSLNEKDILVKLNHNCLPKISDLFHDEGGSYIIESYVEGLSMDSYLKINDQVSEDMVIDWMIQLCDALNYIHSKNILHMDIKPHNVIVTEDNQAILIDFGIATHINDKNSESYKVYGYSPVYCSPEQKDSSLAVDERSDLFSLAATAIHVLTKQTKISTKALNEARSDISLPFIELLDKCLSKYKDERYHNALDLKNALMSIKDLKRDKDKAIARNKILRVAVIPLLIASCTLFIKGYDVRQNEILSIIEVNLNNITLTEQETQLVEVQQVYPDGDTKELDPQLINWTVADSEVASVHNGEIIGKNPGSTIIEGQYMNKLFSIDVTVDSGVLGVDITLKYNTNEITSLYAGNGVRDIVDGDVHEASFLEPSSICYDPVNGKTYLVDRFLRVIEDDQVTTIDSGFIQPDVVRVNHSGKMYFASKEWIDAEDVYRLGLFELVGGEVSEVVSFDVLTTEISDFTFDKKDNIYLIMTDYIGMTSSVVRIASDLSAFDILLQNVEHYEGIAVDEAGRVYLSQPETAVINVLEAGGTDLQFAAGAKYEKDFVDGEVLKLFEPMKLVYEDGYLYVVDHHLIRKIKIEDGYAVDSETISGNIEVTDAAVIEGLSHEVSYLGGLNMDICISDQGLLVADSESNVVRSIINK